jgi:DNA polymerase I-like protein with 3'-5' exonuclease and polymerase domains
LAEKIAAKAKKIMESAQKWVVPLVVSVKVGRNWAEITK